MSRVLPMPSPQAIHSPSRFGARVYCVRTYFTTVDTYRVGWAIGVASVFEEMNRWMQTGEVDHFEVEDRDHFDIEALHA